MPYYASEIVKQAQSWIGLKESDGSFMKILNVYNNMPQTHGISLPRGHKMVKTDSWCACFTSACALAVNHHTIAPIECSCTKIIEQAKKMEIWIEDESITPKAGWLAIYDWEDKSGKADNKGNVDHIGIVEKTENGKITVIEGNYDNAVKRRVLDVNGKYLRGFVAPRYDEEPIVSVAPTKPSTYQYNPKVEEWQKAAIKDGFKFPVWGADGEWGDECRNVAKKAVVKRNGTNWMYKNLTKIIQRAVGVEQDGKFGPDTEKAVKAFQKKHGLEVDGEVGINTWSVILGVS